MLVVWRESDNGGVERGQLWHFGDGVAMTVWRGAGSDSVLVARRGAHHGNLEGVQRWQLGDHGGVKRG